MKRTFITLLIAASLMVAACNSAPKLKTVDGSQREPVNKSMIKSQTGGSNGR